jgi:acyl carrier protein
MSNFEKYKSIIKDSFQYAGDVEQLEYQAINEWDSVGHMQLMTALEDAFSIEMDVDDIIEFSSFTKGISILAKYNVIIKK